MQTITVRQGSEECLQVTARFHDPECAPRQMRPISVRRREIGKQCLRNVLAIEGRGGGQFDAREFGKIGGDGVADVYGSGSRDNGSVWATTPFGPRPVIDRHVVSAKAGQGQGQN